MYTHSTLNPTLVSALENSNGWSSNNVVGMIFIWRVVSARPLCYLKDMNQTLIVKVEKEISIKNGDVTV
jgi:hypothetical protein